jgi:uncharacterized NAD(P)/FAD-binding protein YdhS
MRSIHDVPPEPFRVVIVGGGAAAVVAAVHLIRHADLENPLEVHIVERRGEIGPGLAYRTTHPRHLVNNFAGRLSAVDGDPDHLLRWCRARGLSTEPTSFVKRQTYGAYLADVLHDIDVPEGSALGRTWGTVRDVVRDNDGLRVHVDRDQQLRADTVVLALGNPPPRRDLELERRGNAYIADPWAGDLHEAIGEATDVLLLGTGLTMVDAVVTLHDRLPLSRFTAMSRNGLLPAAHRRMTGRLHDTFHPGLGSVAVVVGAVHARIEEVVAEGGDWRDVIDSVRASANDLWVSWSPTDQERFVEQVARAWEVARHRMPPEAADLINRLVHAGRLRVTRTDQLNPAHFPRVVNCTGPAPVPTRGWNPLVDRLLDRGTIRAHRLGLGLDLDEHGRVIGQDGEADPDVYVLGAARRGLEWEVTAIPDLRSQSVRLADHALGARKAAKLTELSRSGSLLA